MTDAISGKELVAQQAVLQTKFENAQNAMQDAKVEYEKVSAELVEFRDKYGRVLQLFDEKFHTEDD